MPTPVQCAPLTFESLYRAHHGWLTHWLARKLQSAFDADDVAQDTFLRIINGESLTAIRDPKSFKCTQTKPVNINQLPHNSLEKEYIEIHAHLPQTLAPSAEEKQSHLETLQLVDRMLDGLSAKARTTFLLSQLDGLTYSDIAQRLNVSVSSVKKYVAKATEHCLLFRLEHDL